MKGKAYYQAIEEYQRLISQKQFNEYFLDRKRLDEVKGSLERAVKYLIAYVNVDLIDSERKAKKAGVRPDLSSKHEFLERQREHLFVLLDKIALEEPLDEQDYENTFLKPKFIAGLTLPQTCFCLLAFIAFLLISKFLF